MKSDKRPEQMHSEMKILIACEESQAVTKAFRKMGHEAYSCDILPCSGGKPEWHIQGNVLDILQRDWNMVIAFPPCTDLAVSGARWFKEKQADGRQQKSIDFFMEFTKLKCKWAIENPVGIMSTNYRRPDQIIQPWQYGHGETKATCLWLNGLPKLQPSDIVDGREQRIWKMAPGPDRAKERSKTYAGVAEAMAKQWGLVMPPPQESKAEICDNCRYMMFNKIWYCTQGREENCFGGTCELFDTPF